MPKKPKKIKKGAEGYQVDINDDDGISYSIFISNKEMTDLELTKQLIKNRVNMYRKHTENIAKLMETLL